MSTYVIGDVQGCFDALQRLLAHIQFSHQMDKLYFAGDLVNRGSQSLETLHFIQSLGDKAVVVLGNHDLHLLAVQAGYAPIGSKDTFSDILTSQAADELCQWLKKQPLLYHDPKHAIVLVHAGILPGWDLNQAKHYASEVEATLQNKGKISCDHFLSNLYGNTPSRWDPNLTGVDRLRFITNVLTRLRFVDQSGHLDLTYKGNLENAPANLIPWFSHPNRHVQNSTLIFGHWAALQGQCTAPNTIAIDTGCCWGGHLSAYCIETGKIDSVDCIPKVF